jgi:hypothetical protein
LKYFAVKKETLLKTEVPLDISKHLLDSADGLFPFAGGTYCLEL